MPVHVVALVLLVASAIVLLLAALGRWVEAPPGRVPMLGWLGVALFVIAAIVDWFA